MSRPIITYTFPPKFHDTEHKPQSIGLIRLTAGEEIMAFNRAPGNPHKTQFELAKQSIVRWNGQPVSIGDGSVDRLFDTCDPKVRGLILGAYSNIHNPTGGEGGLFLASETISIE